MQGVALAARLREKCDLEPGLGRGLGPGARNDAPAAYARGSDPEPRLGRGPGTQGARKAAPAARSVGSAPPAEGCGALAWQALGGARPMFSLQPSAVRETHGAEGV